MRQLLASKLVLNSVCCCSLALFFCMCVCICYTVGTESFMPQSKDILESEDIYASPYNIKGLF